MRYNIHIYKIYGKTIILSNNNEDDIQTKQRRCILDDIAE